MSSYLNYITKCRSKTGVVTANVRVLEEGLTVIEIRRIIDLLLFGRLSCLRK
jgi:hypothetical protein